LFGKNYWKGYKAKGEGLQKSIKKANAFGGDKTLAALLDGEE